MSKKWLITLISVNLLLTLTACGGNNNNEDTSPGTPAATVAPTAPDQGADTVNVAEAEQLYKQNCISCHAADLGGGMGPNLQHIGGDLTAAEIHDTIAKGGGGMPAFGNKLTEDQIANITGWLASKT